MHVYPLLIDIRLFNVECWTELRQAQVKAKQNTHQLIVTHLYLYCPYCNAIIQI
jgi:hypothetical protein